MKHLRATMARLRWIECPVPSQVAEEKMKLPATTLGKHGIHAGFQFAYLHPLKHDKEEQFGTLKPIAPANLPANKTAPIHWRQVPETNQPDSVTSDEHRTILSFEQSSRGLPWTLPVCTKPSESIGEDYPTPMLLDSIKFPEQFAVINSNYIIDWYRLSILFLLERKLIVWAIQAPFSPIPQAMLSDTQFCRLYHRPRPCPTCTTGTTTSALTDFSSSSCNNNTNQKE